MAPRKRPRLLSNSRPPKILASQPRTLSARTTRHIIRTHHQTCKKLAQARRGGETARASALQAEINELGGLSTYQQASVQGQSTLRGGDSSRVLVQWMREVLPKVNSCQKKFNLRLLEVGSLSVDNACSRAGFFNVTRIDLHSQHPSILEQDFMCRPIPRTAASLAEDGFDVISLSLVVNYVAEPIGRGEMLARVAKFLRPPAETPADLMGDKPSGGQEEPGATRMFPGLFLVLPAPCITNSRYLNEERLTNIMASLGYELARKKYSTKLAYFYWRLIQGQPRRDTYGKREISKGGGKNNFAIVLE